MAQSGGGGTTTSGGTVPGADRLLTTMAAASGELDNILQNIGVVVESMKKLPGTVNTAMRGLKSSIDTIARQIEGSGTKVPLIVPGVRGFQPQGTQGGHAVGSQGLEVAQNIRRALQNLPSQPSLLGVQIPKPGISSVSKGSIDKAGADRIVKAINRQTDVLRKGLKVRGGNVTSVSGEGTVVTKKSGAGKKAAAQISESVTEVEHSVESTAKRLEGLDRQLAEVMALVGDSADEAMAGLLSQLRSQRAEIQAESAKEERQRTGIKRGEQRERNQKQADKARKEREIVSPEELEARRERAALIATPGAADFTDRVRQRTPGAKGGARNAEAEADAILSGLSISNGPGGRSGGTKGTIYNKAQLDQMVKAYREVGIIVERTSRTTNAELAARLKAARAEYVQTYPTGHPLTQTQGLDVRSKTKVEGETKELLGDLGEAAGQLSRAYDIIRDDRRGGGEKTQPNERGLAVSTPPEDGQPRTGNIMVPPGMVKGKAERGSGLGLLYTEEEYDAAIVRTRADASRESGRAFEGARKADFDPYDQQHDRNIKAGNSPEEIRLAQAARARLRDTRLATKALDAMGVHFLGLSQAADKTQGTIDGLRTKLNRQVTAGQLPDPDDQGALFEATQELENIRRELIAIPKAAKELFNTEDYRKGLATREGLAGEGYTRNDQSAYVYAERQDERNVGSRQVQEARAEFYASRRPTISDYGLNRSALVDSAAGSRTSIGSRGPTRPIPGLTGFDGQFRPAEAGTWSKKSMQKVDAATGKTAQALTLYQRALLEAVAVQKDGSSTEKEKADAIQSAADAQQELEQSANLLANRLAELNNGLAPSFYSLTGLDPSQGSKAEKDEARRLRARERAETLRTTKPKDTVGEKARKADDLVALTKTRLEKAQKAQIEATEKATKAELALAETFEELSQEEREQIRLADGRLNRLKSELNKVEGTALQEGSTARMGDGPDGKRPVLSGDPAERDRARARLEASQRSLRSQRGALTKAETKGDDQKIQAARSKVEKLERTVTSLTEVLGSAEVGLKSSTTLEQKYGERNHSPGEKVDVLGYPSNLGYNEDREAAKKRLTTAIDEARTIRNRLAKQTAADDKTAKLRDELAKRVGDRQGITDKIASAREEGDLKENTGYHAAKEEQGRNEARIKDLQQKLEEGGGGFDGLDKLVDDADKAAAAVQKLEVELAGLTDESKKNDKAVEKRRAALVKERNELSAQPHTKEDRNKLLDKPDEFREALERSNRLKEVRRELEDLGPSRGEKKAKATSTVPASEKAEISVTSAARIKELRAERAEIQKNGEYTRTELKKIRREQAAVNRQVSAAQGQLTKANKTGDATKIAAAEKTLDERRNQSVAIAERLATAEARRNRLKTINDDIKDLRGGSGGGSGDVPGGGGGGRDRDRDLLRKILAKLTEIHGTIKGGVKFDGTGGPATKINPNVPVSNAGQSLNLPRTSNPAAEVAAARSGDPELMRAAAEDQAKREKLLKADPATNQRSAAAQLALANAQKEALSRNNKLKKEGFQVENATFLQQQRINQIYNLTSASTQEMVEDLQRLVREGAEDAQIAERRLALYRQLDKELQGQRIKPAQRQNIHEEITNVTTPGNTSTQNRAIVGELQQTARSLDGFQIVDSTMAQSVSSGGIFGEESAFTRAMFGNAGFWSRVMNSTGTFVVRNFTAGFVFGLTNALQDVITQAIQTEATFVRVSHALEATGREVGTLRNDLQGLASSYAVSLNDVYEVAAGLTGLFDTNEELVKGTEVVTQLQLISNGALDAKEAMGAIASIEAGFGGELTERLGSTAEAMQHIGDVLTSVQNNIGTNAEVTAEAVASLSGLANQLGLSYEEVAVYGAQIAKLTNQTGAGAGEQFSRVLASFQTSRGREAIFKNFQPTKDAAEKAGVNENIGEEVTGLLQGNDYSGALRKMMEGWDALSESQQRNLTVALGGQRQARAVAALFANGAKTIDDVRRAEDSFGDASERSARVIRTLNKQIEQFRVNFQTLANELLRTGILDSFGLLLLGANKLLAAIAKLLGIFNTFADNTPFLGTLRDYTFGLLGLALAATVVAKAFRGMKASMAASLANSPMVQAARQPVLGPGALDGGRSLTSRIAGTREGELNRAGRTNPGIFAGARSGSDEAFRPLTRSISAVMRPLGAGATRVSGALLTLSRATEVSRAAMLAQARAANVSGARVAVTSGLSRSSSLLTGVAGRGIGGFGNFLSQGPTGYLNDRSQGLAVRQASRVQRASDLRALAERNVSTGDTTENSRILRQARLDTGVGRAAGLASGSMNRLSSGLGKLAATGIGADLAMAGLTAAILFLFSEAQDQKAASKSARDAVKQRYGTNEEDEDGEDKERYIGPATDAFLQTSNFKEASDPDNGFFDNLKTFGRGGMIAVNAFTGIGPNKDQAFGTENDGKAAYGFNEAQKIATSATDRLTELAKQPGVTAQQLSDEAAKVQKEIEDTARDINDRDISGEQRLAGQAMLEGATDVVQTLVGDLTANIYALEAANRLTVEQIGTVTQLRSTFSSVAQSGYGSSIGQVGQDALSLLANNSGINPDSITGRQLNSLANSAGGSRVVAAQTAIDNIDESMANAVIEFNRLSSTGAEEDAIEQAATTLQGLINEKISAIQTFMQVSVDEANLLSEEALASGDPRAAAAAIQKSITDINQKRVAAGLDKPSFALGPYLPGTGPTQVFQPEAALYNQQLRQQQLAQANLLGEQAALPFNLAAAKNNDPTQTAVAEVQKTATVLQSLKEARRQDGDAGASVQQINQAKIDWYNATINLARQADQVDMAELAAAAAAIWNPAARASAETNIANRRLQSANEYGTPEEQANAQAGVYQAEQAEASSYEAQAAAARETAVAQIAPADAVAIARQQVANAQAAQAYAAQFGTSSVEYQSATQQVIAAQQTLQSALATVAQANAQLAAAYANARGDQVAAARAGVQAAAAALRDAQQRSGGARTAEVINAQAALVTAHAGVADAQLQLIQSQSAVGIALAEAAGNTVIAAERSLAAAREALAFQLKRSGGERTAEVNAAQAQVISAEAALRDARLQDQLDTIDFNLQMGIITQSSAIAALREILRTNDLTKAQRRQLLLQIKGMKDELANSQFNFGDITLPTPYQMRRYIEQRKKQFRNQSDQLIQASSDSGRSSRTDGGSFAAGTTNNNQSSSTTTIYIDGAETDKVKRIIQQVVGTSGHVNTRTTGARRGR